MPSVSKTWGKVEVIASREAVTKRFSAGPSTAKTSAALVQNYPAERKGLDKTLRDGPGAGVYRGRSITASASGQ